MGFSQPVPKSGCVSVVSMSFSELLSSHLSIATIIISVISVLLMELLCSGGGPPHVQAVMLTCMPLWVL